MLRTQQQQQQRMLTTCPVPCNPRTQIVISICKRQCGMAGMINQPGEVVDATSTVPIMDGNRYLQSTITVFGKRNQLLPGFGAKAAASVFNIANSTIQVGPCQAMILDMKYAVYAMPRI
jgi:hypothetical protein